MKRACRLRALVAGTVTVIQDIFPMVNDQPLSRSDINSLLYNPSHIFAGAAIMIMSLVLFENEFLNIVAISFTALVLNELIMVGLEITTW